MGPPRSAAPSIALYIHLYSCASIPCSVTATSKLWLTIVYFALYQGVSYAVLYLRAVLKTGPYYTIA